MLLYYITDRAQFSGGDAAQRQQLLARIAAVAAAGVEFIQLREKDLSISGLEQLAREARRLIDASAPAAGRSRLLVNSRIDVAIAVGADGVHLTAGAREIAASDARAIFARCGVSHPVIGVSCHTAAEVALAASHGADFAVFGPVFSKDGVASEGGLERLREACAHPSRCGMPVLALGGVDVAKAAVCAQAGAAGVAAIRLFQQAAEKDLPALMTALRALRTTGGEAGKHPYWPTPR